MKIKFFIAIILIAFFSSCSEDNSVLSDEELNLDNSAIENHLETVVNSSAQEAIAGEYIVVLKNTPEERTINSFKGKETISDNELARVQEYYTQKSLQILNENNMSQQKLEDVFVGILEGFHVKNVSDDELIKLKEDDRVAYIEPNYIIEGNFPKPENLKEYSEKELKSMLSSPESIERSPIGGAINSLLPNGETLPWGVGYVGRRSHGSTGRKAWVIDTGIAPHPDLRIATAFSRSFIAGENWRDVNGHGTHVAGTIAAKNNGRGVIGVCFGAKVVALKVFNRNGGSSTSILLRALQHVFVKARRGDVYNYSIGYSNRQINNAIDNAFRALNNRGISGAIAAGNNNDNTRFYSPQRLRTSHTWIVGAIKKNRKIPTSFTNFGQSVDRWAPGQNVISTWLNGRYVVLNGTSMAAPHVAGILLARGNNSVGRRGTTSKRGFTKPRAKL